jgi:selenide,water dikinase
MARRSGMTLDIRYGRIPFLAEAAALAEGGYATGASGRNWASYGDEVVLRADLPAWRRNLLTDPQTSGGLLVACAPERAEDIRASIEAAGYPLARIIGSVSAGEPVVRIS